MSPILEIVPVPFDTDLTKYTSLIFTSENAVLSLSRVKVGIPRRAFCVGDGTAKAARNAGFEALSAGGDANDLRSLIKNADLDGPALHIRGRHISSDIAKTLSLKGLVVDQLTTYDQVERPLSDEALAALQSGHAVLPLYSKRTAHLARVQIADLSDKVRVIAISPAVASAWGGPEGQTRNSASPSGKSMLDAIVFELSADSTC